MSSQPSERPAIVIPEIMTANTYYWRPGSSASQRRSNEARRAAEVRRFLEARGGQGLAVGLEVHFEYSESCHNVYN